MRNGVITCLLAALLILSALSIHDAWIGNAAHSMFWLELAFIVYVTATALTDDD